MRHFGAADEQRQHPDAEGAHEPWLPHAPGERRNQSRSDEARIGVGLVGCGEAGERTQSHDAGNEQQHRADGAQFVPRLHEDVVRVAARALRIAVAQPRLGSGCGLLVEGLGRSDTDAEPRRIADLLGGDAPEHDAIAPRGRQPARLVQSGVDEAGRHDGDHRGLVLGREDGDCGCEKQCAGCRARGRGSETGPEQQQRRPQHQRQHGHVAVERIGPDVRHPALGDGHVLGRRAQERQQRDDRPPDRLAEQHLDGEERRAERDRNEQGLLQASRILAGKAWQRRADDRRQRNHANPVHQHVSTPM